MNIYTWYRAPALTTRVAAQFAAHAESVLGHRPDVVSEICFLVEASSQLAERDNQILQWLLAETYQPEQCIRESLLGLPTTTLIIGPRLNFVSPWSTNAVSICHACGVLNVTRIERFARIGISAAVDSADQKDVLVEPFHDRMTEARYDIVPNTFVSAAVPASTKTYPVLECGRTALETASCELGLGWDEQDIDMVTTLFVEVLQRDPTDVELFQIGQANSEHCRHHLFRGEMCIDGETMPSSLMDIVKTPWLEQPGNSIIAFADDSSALRGSEVAMLVPDTIGRASSVVRIKRTLHPTLTAETHNFPSAVAPYPGAATGTGGRIRDNLAVGRGGYTVASGAAYCVGNLQIPDDLQPWETDSWQQPDTVASPLDILINASNGASDYGNCFGEPVVCGFVRTADLGPDSDRRSWHKPIMYTAGFGQLDGDLVAASPPTPDMVVLYIGGPSYRIGMGGGSASSMAQGENDAGLDFNAVQRGDPEMEQRVARLFRACLARGSANPLLALCDLGAGGSCNAFTELVHPAGACIDLSRLPVGDVTLSPREVWGNEAQERMAALVRNAALPLLRTIAAREDVPLAVIGTVTGDNRLVLHNNSDGSTPVDLPLQQILGELPRKRFESEVWQPNLVPLQLPDDLTVAGALERVLRLPAVASKRFLTTKVDRSVTGRVIQQQCVGPNHLTVSDYALDATGFWDSHGRVSSLGERPLVGQISPEAMARLAVAEALLNMSGVHITDLADVRASANWMAAAKMGSEGHWLYQAACALRDVCIPLGIAVDGGKDSSSMATRWPSTNGEVKVAKAPGQLVIAAYAGVPDMSQRVTCELKKPGNYLVHIDLSGGLRRLGGSALAQVFGQLGDTCPDVSPKVLGPAFCAVQELISEGVICAAHDVSDGGLLVCLMEMAFAGNLGLQIDFQGDESEVIKVLFAEEPGLVVETSQPERVSETLRAASIPHQCVGRVGSEVTISVRYNGKECLNVPMVDMRALWEATSTSLDARQANPACVEQEAEVNYRLLTPPPYRISFAVGASVVQAKRTTQPAVAIIRERGSNGDEEMKAAFMEAGFNAWDVNMADIVSGEASLDHFRGVAFVGGFSFADVLGAGKGWAGVIQFNDRAQQQLETFYARDDTFSFGVCNGCQLMTLLGWVPHLEEGAVNHPRFVRNESERFESRFPAVRILDSPAIMLQGMQNSVLGVWTAHGEGRLHVPEPSLLDRVVERGLAPIRYVDRGGEATTAYPHNPNGSPHGIAALCSEDGRHLAMMPHPERAWQLRQWPWVPADWHDLSESPWLQLFRNAYDWCVAD